nr:immunoglobulin heavy chain junction region [Mus musculus]MBK4183828.1 immunoglobulin heavy chain junction region [Mus musculus]MBK4183829.1 immunoglobulin heavy chain junction region [Mus musculus]
CARGDYDYPLFDFW